MTLNYIPIIIAIVAADLINAGIFYGCIFFEDNKKNPSPKEIFFKIPKMSLFFWLVSQKKEVKFRPNFGYFLVLFITLLLTMAAIQQFLLFSKGLVALIFIYSLITLTFIDAKTYILPDVITKPLIAVGLIQGYFGVFTDFRSSLLGAVLGYGIFWGINALFKLIRKKEGIGGGDFKLLAAIGAWAGASQLPLVIFMSSIIALMGTVATAPLVKKELSAPLPYGPYLAISGLVALCFGDQIIAWYLGILGV